MRFGGCCNDAVMLFEVIDDGFKGEKLVFPVFLVLVSIRLSEFSRSRKFANIACLFSQITCGCGVKVFLLQHISIKKPHFHKIESPFL